MPVLVLGGEAFFAPACAQRDAFDPVVANLETAVTLKAGHWIVSSTRSARISIFVYADRTAGR